MTKMAFENISSYSLSQIKDRIEHWKAEYPDVDLFIGNIKGEPHIVGTNEQV